MAARLRVGVWGTGQIGQACVRLLHDRPEFDIAGAFVYEAAKDGRDVGEIVGIGPVGATAITDRDAFLAADMDCVVYTAYGLTDWKNDGDLLDLLAAGKNVVTSLPYRNIGWRGGDARERFEQAAAAGGVTFYAGGVDPDLVSERVLLALSAGCTDISSILLTEYFRVDTAGPDVSQIFGNPLDEQWPVDVLTPSTANYCVPSILAVAEKMGRPIERVDSTVVAHPAPVPLVLRNATVQPGTTGMFEIRHAGLVSDAPFYTIVLYYFVTEAMRPPGVTVDESWTLEVEGRPSYRLSLESMASVVEERERYEDDPTPPGAYVTAADIVQAIPSVVAAAPGILDVPPTHWRSDLRRPVGPA